MTTATIPSNPASASGIAPKRTVVKPVTLPRLVTSERIKTFSVRSTYWIYAIVFALWIGFGALIVQVSISMVKNGENGGFSIDELTQHAAGASQAGLQFGQLAIAVLGALIITSEYSTGMIRSTFAAAPKRLPSLWAKAIVLGVSTFVFSIVTSFISYGVTSLILNAQGYETSITNPDELRMIFGAAIFLTLTSLFALAIGALVRNTAGAISIAIAFMLVVPILANLIPGDFGKTVYDYLPSTTGTAILQTNDNIAAYGPWGGTAIFAGYVVVLLAAAAILMKRRDA